MSVVELSPHDEVAVADAEEPAVLALLFDDLDGRRRAIALATVDRVETVASDAFVGDGQRFLPAADALLPLYLAASVEPGDP